LMRFLPRGWFWDKMVLATAVGDSSAAQKEQKIARRESLVGQIGTAATDLFPSGQVEINGKWHDAKVAVGTLEKGREIRVVSHDAFDLTVEATDEEDDA
ncbi:hypothetical protein N9K67_07890, partial [Opitutaceae bacterium]|nr:hypothetical protein [Opitutaceae bacterium]